MTTLVLPYPPSANRYWRTYMPKGFAAPVTALSPDAKKFKRDVAAIARRSGVRKITGPIEIAYRLFPKRPLDWAKRAKLDPNGWQYTVQSIDLDNATKVLVDALKELAYDDDRWVQRITGERAIPDGEARVEVTITAFETRIVQPALPLVMPERERDYDPLAA